MMPSGQPSLCESGPITHASMVILTTQACTIQSRNNLHLAKCLQYQARFKYLMMLTSDYKCVLNHISGPSISLNACTILVYGPPQTAMTTLRKSTMYSIDKLQVSTVFIILCKSFIHSNHLHTWAFIPCSLKNTFLAMSVQYTGHCPYLSRCESKARNKIASYLPNVTVLVTCTIAENSGEQLTLKLSAPGMIYNKAIPNIIFVSHYPD